MLSKVPKDIKTSILFPFMHSNTLLKCIRDYPMFEVIESHPKFDKNIALPYASFCGYLEIVKYLVSVGADIHTEYDKAVHNACVKGHLDIVKYLVSVGADIHILDGRALRAASLFGHLDIVKYLVSVGADAKNDIAIRLASQFHHAKVVEFLEK